jgi:hypothetical protein
MREVATVVELPRLGDVRRLLALVWSGTFAGSAGMIRTVDLRKIKIHAVPSVRDGGFGLDFAVEVS